MPGKQLSEYQGTQGPERGSEGGLGTELALETGKLRTVCAGDPEDAEGGKYGNEGEGLGQTTACLEAGGGAWGLAEG